MSSSISENIFELHIRLKSDIDVAVENIGTQFMRQGHALERLSQTYDEDAYREAVSMAFHTKGHLVVIGMGKSGHVGRKISATLASTGTPSFFLHPAEASHGDLGMVTPDATLLIISYSGETEEIVQLLPSLKAFGNHIIAVTGAKNSSLARASDVVLEIPVVDEVCPNNLAPTTSILMTIAIGDSLAMALMHLRDFHAKDFARYHPGGALGRRLLLKVGDVMYKENVPTVGPEMVLLDLAAEMAGGPVGVAVVLGSDDRPLGIVTKEQLGTALQVTRRIREVTALQCMTRDFKSILSTKTIDDAESLLRQHQGKLLVAVDQEGRFTGVYLREDG